MIKTLFRWLLAIAFFFAGINHFINPGPYLSMMPGWLPYPDLLHKIAGAAEVAGAIGVLLPPFRRLAAWGLLALLVAIFPANLHIALNGWEGVAVPQWTLWARLPFHLVFMAWVWWTCLQRQNVIPKV
jgi:uncharacterized membrane protein